MPPLVRGSFGGFALVLIAAGGPPVLGADNILPWQVTEETGVMVGLTFLGAESSYVYGFTRPVWGYVYAPLLGFLAYDLVLLLPPLVDHFSGVVPEQRTSLVIYVAALAHGAALAAYYLLVDESTRLFTRR